jgi:deoxycytidylate deaminase/dephospho-CoA kinase
MTKTRAKKLQEKPAKKKAMQIDLAGLTTDMAVIGFTGALGSGCSYLAHGLAKHHGYAYCSLSSPIHEYAKANGIKETTGNLQDIGNDFRRRLGCGYLVGMAMTQLCQEKETGGLAQSVGIVVDGIRNTGEVDALQQLPNFFLVSVQAETDVRKQRLIGKGKKFKDEAEFDTADARDRDEHTRHGQQVKPCNYLSDIIVINEKEVSEDAQIPHRQYIRDVIYDSYITLIEHVSKGLPPNERRAKPQEALMTAAYVESKRSSCLKRKVGAVIASPTGDIIAAGHNDVPEASDPCLTDPRYGWCARDVIQERLGRQIRNCPNCGKIVKIRGKCENCGKNFSEYVNHCPTCHSSVDMVYVCPKCSRSVFTDFLAGSSAETGKLLDLCRSLHAEENAILNLAKFGIHLPHFHRVNPEDGKKSLEACSLFSTTFPCNLCANKIVTVGIKKVVYAEPYTMEEARNVFKKEGVILERFQGVKSRAFFRLYA